MGLLDGILGAVTGGDGTDAIAEKLGIDPQLVETAISALGAAHDEPGDTVDLAAGKSGIDRGTLASVTEMLGGEDALGKVSGMMKDNPDAAGMLTRFLDRDGDGSALDDIAGMAGKFFGKK